MPTLTTSADKSGIAAIIGTGLGLFAMSAVAVIGALASMAMMAP